MRDWNLTRRGILRTSFGMSAAIVWKPAFAQQKTTLVGALEGDPTVFNAAVSSAISTYVTSSPIHQGLTRIKPDGSIEPLLAKSWEISPDGKTYVFTLRDDVLWQDGRPFTSADVKFTIENAIKTIQPRGKAAYTPVTAVDAPNASTVVYRLSAPSAELMMATDAVCAPIIPKHLWEGKNLATDPLNQKPVGTGPYKLVSYQRGREVRYEKNENYFIKGRPMVDEVVLRIMPDPASRVAAFQQGELDMMYYNALPQSEAIRLSKLPGNKLTRSVNRGAAYHIVLNLKNQHLANKEVRKAIAHAIDRKFIRENIDGGMTASEQLGPVSPADPLYNKKLVDYTFDAAQANRMLDEAGFKRGADGTRFELELGWASSLGSAANIADIIKQNLAAVGIKLNLFSADRAAFDQRAYATGNFAMTIEAVAIGPGVGGIERFYNSNNIRPVPYTNNSDYRSEEVDALFTKQRSILDPVERKAVYDRIQEVIWDELPILPLYQVVFFSITRSNYVTDVYEEGGNGSWATYEDAKIVGVHK
ncbi:MULTISPECIES: ABC transporter substrate-binding protein [unclassified Chelatococcus]|uniref:ABC transporter substrate-binding protein n=1 Tax=unclassified Chelatococcus TaxID=2638111 RepID=UPI001BCC4DD2|nr:MULTISPECIES: ABC transporter substrate-binding protein [unclassified Chelatococcus]MBS7700481.1 hypothetical protein [Chelatococcus sp. YT9]MBX3556277.1 hypothetical protein [Chelatococcus sp.]